MTALTWPRLVAKGAPAAEPPVRYPTERDRLRYQTDVQGPPPNTRLLTEVGQIHMPHRGVSLFGFGKRHGRQARSEHRMEVPAGSW